MWKKIDKDESVGSNSWLDGGGGVVSPPPRQQQQRIKDGDVCFSCQQKGHWDKDCPNKIKNNMTPPGTGTTTQDGGDQDQHVDLMCPCGAGCCKIFVSKTARNPNRNFYRCPLYEPKACNFFKWCDELFLITGPPPPCPCGAGLCCVFIQHQHQQNHRRSSPSYLFVCPINKGHGACNFIQPVDAATYNKGEASMSSITSSPKSPLTLCFSGDTTTRPSSSSSAISDKITEDDESCDISFQVPESESSVSGTPQQHPPIQLETSCRVPWDDEMRKLINFLEQEEEEEEEEEEESPLRQPHHHDHKCQRDRAPKNNDDIHDSRFDHNCDILVANLEGVPSMNTLAIRDSASVCTPDKVFVHQQRQRRTEFFGQISPAAGPTNPLQGISSCSPFCASSTACDYGSSPPMHNCLEPTVMYQILGFQVEGWCGRLVFPPSPCLTFPAPRPFFCCVFPSFDPIFVPGDDNGDVTESNKPTHGCGHLLGGGIVKVGLSGGGGVDQSPPCKISRGNNNNNNNNNAMTLSILDVFKQAAARLEEELLNLLELMECHEHKSMVREADLVFDALDNLSVVDYSPFKERVMGFVSCAVKLSELDSSSPISKESCIKQEVVDKHSRLQMELEDISSQCSEVSAALMASNKHLNFLMLEEARIKELLHNILAEILCCEAENEDMSSRLDKMTQEKHRSELRVQAAKEEVEQAHRLRQQREAQLGVAKALFEQARSKLRERQSFM